MKLPKGVGFEGAVVRRPTEPLGLVVEARERDLAQPAETVLFRTPKAGASARQSDRVLVIVSTVG